MAAVLLVILGFLLMPPLAAAVGQVCGNAGNYTATGTYHSNLAFLAATLPVNISSSPQLFATATAGRAPDTVYELALCRGDVTNVTACSACVAASFRYAQRMCPSDKGAAVYDDDCLLGFSSDDFLAPSSSNNLTQDNSTLFQFWNDQTIADVRDLLTQTAQEAAAAPRRFFTAFMDASGSAAIPTLYSLAQCTPDLSAGDCLACLQRIIGVVNATTSVRVGGRVLVLRCNFRFEKNMFFDGQAMKRITPSSIAPAPPLPDPTTNKRPGSKPWAIATSVAAPLAVVTSCFIFYCRWHRRSRKGGSVRY